MKIAGSVVLLTGASDGIGAACARVLRERGAKLALTGRSQSKLAAVSNPGDLSIAADLTTPGCAEMLVRRTVEFFGRIDILINNAGWGIYWPVAASPEPETRRMFDVNFFAPLALIRAALPHMRAQRSGTIVNVGSIAGSVALPWIPLYSASKSALAMLTAGLRMELAGTGVHPMLVAPGYVLTDFQAHSAGIAPPERVVGDKRFAISPSACARDIVRGIEHGSRVVMSPRWGWLLVAMHRLAPRAVEHHLLRLQHSGGRLTNRVTGN